MKIETHFDITKDDYSVTLISENKEDHNALTRIIQKNMKATIFGYGWAKNDKGEKVESFNIEIGFKKKEK